MLKSFKFATLREKHSAVYWAVSDGETYTWLGVWPQTWVSQVSIPVIPRLVEAHIWDPLICFWSKSSATLLATVYWHRDQHFLRAHRRLGLIVWRLSDSARKPFPHSHGSKTPDSQSVCPAGHFSLSLSISLSHSPSISSCREIVRPCEVSCHQLVGQL